MNSATGVFTYTPANNSYTGTDTFTYTVTDGIGASTPATVTITINALPSAATHSYVTDAGVAFTTDTVNGLLAGATGNNLTAAIATQPLHGALSNVNSATGVFTYTPANNSYTGTDSFSYTVTDGIGTSAPATVTITINALPTAAAQSYSTDAGVAFTSTAANSLLKGATGNNLTAAIATQPTHGALSNVNGATGVFTYTPANNQLFRHRHLHLYRHRRHRHFGAGHGDHHHQRLAHRGGTAAIAPTPAWPSPSARPTAC